MVKKKELERIVISESDFVEALEGTMELDLEKIEELHQSYMRLYKVYLTYIKDKQNNYLKFYKQNGELCYTKEPKRRIGF